MVRTAVIIPARYASTRFPGKPLHRLGGKPMIQHVWERCRRCERISRVVIATDDDRIRDAAEKFGAEVCMTAADHVSGTDRIAEAARHIPEATHLLNVQGDEPLIAPELIGSLARMMEEHPEREMITAVHPLRDEALLNDPNVVKAVLAADGRALYFSRSAIPCRRTQTDAPVYWRHMGIYGYSRAFLERFVAWPPSPLERTESLEQLRALENGASIHCVIAAHESPGIDTPEQAAEMERYFAGAD